MIRLEEINLNLLAVFRLLYLERKTTRVAERLGVGQSSVSYALAKLRRLFGDQLFERTARGLRPTSFADQINAPIAQALATLQEAVNFRDRFDPATSNRRFTIAMTDIGEIYFLPKLTPEISRIAPGVQLSTVRDSTIELDTQMEAGQVDLAVGWLPLLNRGFKQHKLFMQNYVCLMRRGHPLARGKFSLNEFRKAKHAVVVFRETGHIQIEHALAELTDTPVVQIRLPHFVAIPYILAESDLVVTVTAKFAERAAEHFDLIAREHPLKLPSAPISLFWHTRFDNDAGHRWLRALFVKNFLEN